MKKPALRKLYDPKPRGASHPPPAGDKRTILTKVPKLRKIKPPKPGRG